MKEFLQAVEENEELRAKVEELNRSGAAGPAEFSALAREYGFALTEDDFTDAGREPADISEEELEMVASGVTRRVSVCGGQVSHTSFA